MDEIKKQFHELVIAFVRTTVPPIVGALLAYLATRGISLDLEVITALTSFLTVLFSGLYYIAARLLELKYKEFSLLIINRKPKYAKGKR